MKKTNIAPGLQTPTFTEKITAQPFKVYGIFLFIIFLVFLQSLKFDFTNHDDQGLLASKALKLSNIKTIFEHGVFYFTDEVKPEKDTYYRPVQNVIYALGKDIGGKRPFIFHLINILLHFISACLLYNFLTALGNKKNISFLSTLIFIVHPLLVQAVVWIPGTGELLITIFLLAASIQLIHFLQTEKLQTIYIIFSGLLFLLALLSKESAIGFFPLVLFYIFLKRKTIKNIKIKTLLAFFCFAIVVACWYVLRQNAIGQYSQVTFSSLTDSLMKHGSLVFYYLSKAFFPFSLSPLPSLDDINFITTGFILATLVVSGLFIKEKKFSWLLLFGLFWYLIFLVPTLFVAQTDFDFYVYNHRAYLPLIGIILIVTEVFNFNHKKYSSAILYLTFFLPFTIFLFSSFIYAKAFKNAASFFQTSVDNSPHSLLAYQGLGILYLKNNDCDKAIEIHKRLVEIKPEIHSFYGLVGNSYLNCKNDIPNSIRWYEKAMKADAKTKAASNTAISLGNIYSMALRDTGKAIYWYNKAIQIDPDQSFPMSMLGNIYLTRASNDSAGYWFKKTLKKDTTSSVALYGLGSLAYSERDYKEASLYFEKALQYNSSEIQIVKFLMLSYRKLNDYNNTLKYAEEYKRYGGLVPNEILTYLK